MLLSSNIENYARAIGFTTVVFSFSQYGNEFLALIRTTFDRQMLFESMQEIH